MSRCLDLLPDSLCRCFQEEHYISHCTSENQEIKTWLPLECSVSFYICIHSGSRAGGQDKISHATSYHALECIELCMHLSSFL